MMKESMQKHVLILSAMIVGAVALGAYQYTPIHRQKQELKKTLDAQALTKDEIQAKCSRLPVLHRQVLELGPRALEYDRRLPERKEFARLWQQIAEIMNRSQLSEQLVRPGTEVREGGLCVIPLQIEGMGTFEQIFTFFRELETFDRLIRMEAIQLQNDSDLSGRLHLVARAQVYYQSGGDNES